MASPFKIFRKYQKTLLVVAGVVLMLVFVVGDSLSTYIRGAAGGAGREGALAPNAVAVRWDGGKLTNRELEHLVMRRRLLNAFLRTIIGAGEQAAIDAGVEPRPLRVAPVVGPELPDQGVERDVVNTRLLADLARNAGMRISDDTLRTYLDELGRQHVSRDDMRTIIQRMNVGGQRTSIDYMMDALREELLARNYLASYYFTRVTATPEELWRDWLRVNDRVRVAAAAFPVVNFLVDVRDPTEEQLTTFFDKYKQREPQPDFLHSGMELPSAVPGFAIPRKIDVQFIEAEYDKFLTQVENQITDEEIAKYYEDNKDLFLKAGSLLIDEDPTSAIDGGAAHEDEGGATNDVTGADETEGASEPSEGGEDPAAGEPDENEPPAATEPGTTDQSSWRRNDGGSPFRYAAFLDESASNSEGADVAAAGVASGVAAERVEGDVAEAPSGPTLSGERAEPESTSSTAAESSSASASAKPKEYQPLDEVRDEIRQRLAEQRVTKQLIDLMKDLDGELETEFNNYFTKMLEAHTAAPEDGSETPPPPPPTGVLADLPSLAEKHGLKYGTTGPLSYLQMRETPVGQSFDAETQVELSRLLFGSKDLELYQPVSTFDLEGNRYVSMKTSDTPGRVPTLDEVRDEVVKAWKMQEAAKLAEKHAQEVAKKVEESGSSLTDYFAGDASVKVTETDPFSWLTGGEVSRLTGQQQPFRLSEPDGIVAAGPALMRTVFELGDRQVGAALNNDHTMAYVLQVADHELSPEQLRAAYLTEASNWPGMMTMLRDRFMQSGGQLLSGLQEAANLQWERPADQVPENE